VAGAGLTAAEARERLARFGRNELPREEPTPAWRRLLAQLQSPLTLLLVGAAALSLGVWALERHGGVPYEALTIAAVVVLNAVLGFVQEGRAASAVDALERMGAATATVVREGVPCVVPAAEVVPGDLLVVEEGTKVAADARIVDAVGLEAAEAALTGESVPVAKGPNPVPDGTPVADRTDTLFQGTAITRGHGRGIVVATGIRSELGKVADLMRRSAVEVTPLDRELRRIGRVLGIGVVALALVVGSTLVILQHATTVPALVSILLYAVSLAVSAVPEGLTAVTTLVLSVGMQRMARRNVIVRRLSAVETLGAATVICTDKTGTLTRNEMTVRAIVTAGTRWEVTGAGYAPVGEVWKDGRPAERPLDDTALLRLLEGGLLASNATLAERAGQWEVQGDPTEGALVVAARKAGLDPDALTTRFARNGEVPFTSERKRMSTSHVDASGERPPFLVSKGAPDLLLPLCAHEQAGGTRVPLTDARRKEIAGDLGTLAGEALRTLGVAWREVPDGAPLDEESERELVWLGFVGLHDPPRPEASEAVARAKRAGIRVVMITGDHPATALAVAKELGIAAAEEQALSGRELDTLDDAALASAVVETPVFSRVSPAHKLRIVRALKARGEVVAMTGDGVNDAPALKAADIGVAMGRSGTEVAREAADMVLVDDDFASIVAAVEEGRAIYANIQKFLRYLLSSNLGEVVVLFLGVVLATTLGIVKGPGEAVALPLVATMILWINLVTDSGPALALGIDPADPAVMTLPPRRPGDPVITRRMWIGIGSVALVMGAGTLLLLDAGLPGGLIGGSGGLARARTVAFNTLVLFQLVNAFCARSDVQSSFRGLFRNGWLWASVVASLVLQVAVLYVPALNVAFRTVPLGLHDWLVSLAVASSVLWVRELAKWIRRVAARRIPALSSATASR